VKYILGISVIIGDHRVDLDSICFHRFDPPETILTILTFCQRPVVLSLSLLSGDAAFRIAFTTKTLSPLIAQL